MFDVSCLTFAPSQDEGITLVHDVFDGLAILGRSRAGYAAASLSTDSLFNALFFPTEEAPKRFFIPGCKLLIDHTSVLPPPQDIPVGSLIVGEAGVSLLVRANSRGPSAICLRGEHFADIYDGFAIQRWSIAIAPANEADEILFQHG